MKSTEIGDKSKMSPKSVSFTLSIRYIITYRICHNGADKSEYGVLMYLNECFFKLLTHEGMYVILGVTFWTGMKWAKVSKLLR